MLTVLWLRNFVMPSLGTPGGPYNGPQNEEWRFSSVLDWLRIPATVDETYFEKFLLSEPVN
jgi:hypothetical protein